MSEVESYFEVVIPFITEDAAINCMHDIEGLLSSMHIYIREVAE